MSCLSHGLPTNKMKNLFKQKLSIYIWWYAPLPIPSSPQTHSKLCNQWTTPLYHLFRQETYKFHFQEKWFLEPEKSISIVASQLNEKNFVRFSRQKCLGDLWLNWTLQAFPTSKTTCSNQKYCCQQNHLIVYISCSWKLI